MTQGNVPGQQSHTSFPDAVGHELQLLDRAPNVEKNGSRLHAEEDSGATADTMVTADEILDERRLRPELEELQAATDEAVRSVKAPTDPT